jgi:hypothetical protein
MGRTEVKEVKEVDEVKERRRSVAENWYDQEGYPPVFT